MRVSSAFERATAGSGTGGLLGFEANSEGLARQRRHHDDFLVDPPPRSPLPLPFPSAPNEAPTHLPFCVRPVLQHPCRDRVVGWQAAA